MSSVATKADCPHLSKLDFVGIEKRLDAALIAEPCLHCSDSSENWLCLECEGVFCSRSGEAHIKSHNGDTGHNVALSFSDGSVWCYGCDSYVTSSAIEGISKALEKVKLTEKGGNDYKGTTESAAVADEALDDGSESEDEQRPPVEQLVMTYEELVAGLRSNRFEKVAFMTGAGISVAAGIPDFRTPGTGLYAKVEELGLPYPEAIFSLEFLREDPAPFFKIANGFLTYKAKPVKAHHFITKMADESKLLVNYTQNIDGLELDAGVPSELLLQAHGHMRSAHCIECGIEVPISTFFEFVAREKVLYCSACPNKPKETKDDSAGTIQEQSEGGGQETTAAGPVQGIIKPDIVFVGERLPRAFLDRMSEIKQADLVFVMGTSLKVWPFSNLLYHIAPGVPIVLINREDPGMDTEGHPLLFLEGDIETHIAKLARDLRWALPGDPAPVSATAAVPAQRSKLTTPMRGAPGQRPTVARAGGAAGPIKANAQAPVPTQRKAPTALPELNGAKKAPISVSRPTKTAPTVAVALPTLPTGAVASGQRKASFPAAGLKK